MKQATVLLTVALAALLSACSPSGSSTSGGPGGGAAATTDMKQKPSWELREASTFSATIEPWPPQEGAATLKAEVTIGANGKFAGTAEYRFAAAPESSEPWKPLPKVSEDKNETAHFASPVTLNKGPVYVHFRVSDRGAKDGFSTLTDWKIIVK